MSVMRKPFSRGGKHGRRLAALFYPTATPRGGALHSWIMLNMVEVSSFFFNLLFLQHAWQCLRRTCMEVCGIITRRSPAKKPGTEAD